MRLKELCISGFKSFKEKTILPFPSPITAVVGPNGSGKSNIVEAFRFVLGEQSTKTLRGKKGGDLIFTGTSRAKRGCVRIVFDNRDNFFNIPTEEVSVSRCVARDGTNEYRLNDTDVRLKDIRELFSSAHIGSGGHHIISQGESDNILRANPDTLREIIEGSFGLALFQNKKKESIRNLEKARESLREVSIARRETAPRLHFLEKQVKAIEETRALEGALGGVYGEYLAYEHTYLAEKEAELKKEKEAIDIQRKENTAEETDFVADFTKEETDIERELKQVRTMRNDLIRSIGVLEGKLADRSRTDAEGETGVVSRGEITTLKDFAQREYESLKNEKQVVVIFSAFRRIIGKIDVLLKPRDTSAKKQIEDKEKKELAALKEKEVALVKKENDLSEQQQTVRERHTQEREATRQKILIDAEKRHAIALLESEYTHKQEIYRTDQEEYEREQEEARALLGAVPEHQGNHQKRERREQKEQKKEVERMKIRLEETRVSGGGEIAGEYRKAKERSDFLERETTDITQSIESLEGMIRRLEADIEKRFKEGCKKVNESFDMFFKQLFGTGTASLSVAPSDGEGKRDGVMLSVFLPHKRVSGLNQLSGGERSLISIAFLFALSQVTPPPFLVLDETDAALDEANSGRYGAMLTLLARKSQLIVVTHNRETMSAADALYGVTMDGTGESKLLSVRLEEMAKTAP